MKFMKLGTKPDSFQSKADNIRYVASDLSSDIVINVGDVKFYLHKFPLLSKSARLQKLVASAHDSNSDEIFIPDIPGGPAGYEICAKFCYGMIVTLNAYNVVLARCAAEYLEMSETVEKGNLIYKIEVFLNSSILRGWKDSIIVLQTSRSFLPLSEELKVVSHCLDSIASKASIDTSKVDWSYTYNKKKLSSEKEIKSQMVVPRDWWVEDLCELHVDLYKRVISTIRSKELVSDDVIGEALNAYALRRLPSFNKSMNMSNCSDIMKYKSLAQTIISLLPVDKDSVSCGFMLKLLKTSILLDCGETERKELIRRIGQQLDSATVVDLLIPSMASEAGIYDVDIVKVLVKEFIKHYQSVKAYLPIENEFVDNEKLKLAVDESKMMVAKLIDGYLAEIAEDPNFAIVDFIRLAEMLSGFPRSSHDGLYRAIDIYLKEHPEISKSERKKVCRLMDCRKLSAEACIHAMQNERLPLRVVVQVLYFEQMRTTAASTCSSTPDLSGSIKAVAPGGGSNGSSRSTITTADDDWDAETSLNNGSSRMDTEKADAAKMKGLAMSKIFSRLWSNKEREGEVSSSDTSESASSGCSRNMRH